MGMKAHIKGHLLEFFRPFLPTGSYSKSGKYRTNRIKILSISHRFSWKIFLKIKKFCRTNRKRYDIRLFREVVPKRHKQFV